MASYRELINDIRTTGEEWARKRRELAALQNRRKALHVALRDRALREAAMRGEKLSVTAAAEDARAHPEYIACLDEIALKQFEADLAEVAYISARALFQAAVAGLGGAAGLLDEADPFGRSAA